MLSESDKVRRYFSPGNRPVVRIASTLRAPSIMTARFETLPKPTTRRRRRRVIYEVCQACQASVLRCFQALFMICKNKHKIIHSPLTLRHQQQGTTDAQTEDDLE